MELRHLNFDEETRKKIRELYGESVKTLENATCWDDLITPEEKYLTSILKKERRGKDHCPFLGVRGEHFNYCLARAEELARRGIYSIKDEQPSIKSAEHSSRIGYLCLQISCLQDKEHYSSCMRFPLQPAKKRA